MEIHGFPGGEELGDFHHSLAQGSSVFGLELKDDLIIIVLTTVSLTLPSQDCVRTVFQR